MSFTNSVPSPSSDCEFPDSPNGLVLLSEMGKLVKTGTECKQYLRVKWEPYTHTTLRYRKSDKPALRCTFGLARVLLTNRWDDVKLDRCVRGHQRVEGQRGKCWRLRAHWALATGTARFRPTLSRIRVEQTLEFIFKQIITSSHICPSIRQQQKTRLTCIINGTSRTVKKPNFASSQTLIQRNYSCLFTIYIFNPLQRLINEMFDYMFI